VPSLSLCFMLLALMFKETTISDYKALDAPILDVLCIDWQRFTNQACKWASTLIFYNCYADMSNEDLNCLELFISDLTSKYLNKASENNLLICGEVDTVHNSLISKSFERNQVIVDEIGKELCKMKFLCHLLAEQSTET